jgi:hypothetical protein
MCCCRKLQGAISIDAKVLLVGLRAMGLMGEPREMYNSVNIAQMCDPLCRYLGARGISKIEKI